MVPPFVSAVTWLIVMLRDVQANTDTNIAGVGITK